MPEFKNVTTLLIPNSHCQSYISQPVLIFPEEMLNDEPMSMEEDCNSYSTPSYLDRKINRYRKLRAMHERAGRLPKSPISENNNESRS
ncbi:6564_t:CDS:2 [Diversispora eburnea]|uniref:6564_t:CDS:1 n=1 Tax=Diversispora eburnea TaxID=1213867 RepID=A0A9N9C3V5_9GLOM|nr:6564_t:CDS:2 [Diversispora eburnea]